MMTRRSFFALALLPLVAPFLPKPAPASGVTITIIDQRAGGDIALSGRQKLELLIRETVKRGVASGQLDREIARQCPRAGWG